MAAKQDIAGIPLNVIGNLEQPLAATTLQENFVNLSGWIFADNARIIKVTATVNDGPMQMLVHGHRREDVSHAYPYDDASLDSGFSGIVIWESTPAGKVTIDIWVETQDGKKIHGLSRELDYCRPLTSKADLISVAVDQYERWIETNFITSKIGALMRSDARQLEAHSAAKISIVVPIYNTPQQFLEEMVASVIAQIYRHWELILVDDASSQPHIREILSLLPEKDNRIRVIFRTVNGHISEATNTGLEAATGSFIALLDHDDTLPPEVMLHVAECIARHPEVDWIYTDEDKIDSDGRRYDPQFKAGWSPEMAITHNYTHHLTVIRKTLVDKVGGMRKGFEGAQDLDLFLRVAENTTPDKVKHIPQIGYHWRSHEESTASKGTQKTYIFDSAARSIQEALSRRGLDAEPFLPSIAQEFGMCLNQLRWKNSLGVGREVTIVIPTKDRLDLLKKCIDSIFETCNKHFVQILIMDDRSNEDATLEYFGELANNKDFKCSVVKPKRGDGKFNYARLINEAVQHVETPYFLQMNNDVKAIDSGWLDDMMGWMSVEGVGVVGARLLYPDHTIQHAGVVIGPHGGLADHQFHLLPGSAVGHLALPHAARNTSAVTGACLLTTTELFRKLGGFDEINFAVESNDVDFCLRVLESGKRVVYTPQATLTHLTSASRGTSFNPQEHINFVKKYKYYNDFFYNQSIRKDSMWMPVDGGYFSHTERVKKSPIRILLISHALSLTGAPLVALEFARYFAKKTDFDVTVLSLEDGPVNKIYAEEGISVFITNKLKNLYRMNADTLQTALHQISEEMQVDSKFDLIVCNTLTTFWGVILASNLKIPSIWHIHESIGMERYVSTFHDRSVGNLIQSAFNNANRVVFQANATRRLYGEFEGIGNLCTIPGGLPLEKIEKFRLDNSKASLRKKYGISEDVCVVVLIGTTCERKGQTIFLDAIKVIASEKLPTKTLFLLVGAIDSLYTEMLREKIEHNGLHDVQLIAETQDIYDYYGLSDLFVCASFEESFPMVVLLAMAFELPIVSTDVFGIPEIVSDMQEALLIPPGDSRAMAAALLQGLNSRDEADARAAKAHAKLYRLFDSDILHRRHLELVCKVATEETPIIL